MKKALFIISYIGAIVALLVIGYFWAIEKTSDYFYQTFTAPFLQ